MSEVEIMNIKEEIRNSLQPVMLAQYDAIQEGDLCEPPYERRECEKLIGTIGSAMRRLYTLYQRNMTSPHFNFLKNLFWSLLYEEFGEGAILRKRFEVVREK
ncbi:hypothetical protein COT68_01650 [bacterium (Candidatus Torokbacteria) CG09_land_8_20_14_0_10_42_11]|nr:MAG: hypothetical protein COT68_01650 [bacterium (Candidatus Torokbacteria) CG09_land_8_20_14_0_10_42_11]